MSSILVPSISIHFEIGCVTFYLYCVGVEWIIQLIFVILHSSID